MNKIIIKGSRLVTESGVLPAELLVSNGRIEKISSQIDISGPVREIIAENMYTMSGVIDPHVHFELPAYNSVSSDDFYTGSCAAAAGGVTTFIDFAIPSRGQSMLNRINEKLDSAQKKSVIDYSFHAQIINWDDKKFAEMSEIMDYGITSFKIFMPATQGWGLGDSGLFEALRSAAEIKGLIMVHAENGELADYFTNKLVSEGKTSITDYPGARPGFIEGEAVVRACMLAQEAGAPIYVCHVSSAQAISELRELKRKGRDIFVETCPQYLLLAQDIFEKSEGYLFTCCPPIRAKEDSYGLWRAILEGNIDVIGTDHCPFKKEQKRAVRDDFRKSPFGLPGIESSLSLLYTEGVVLREIDIMQLYKIMSLNPAKIFGLYPHKGTLKEGSDADIVIFNPEKKLNVRSNELYTNCDWSPYEGWSLEGYPEYTISRGEIIYENGKIKAEKGRGKFLKRKL
jgi:dihydropyrimidinase